MATERNNSLQGLRAIAFLAIFLSHAGLGNLTVLGAWGVSIFFVLSGFLMMYNYLPREDVRESGISFAWKKTKKLYPLHIVTMLFAALFTVVAANTITGVFYSMVSHSMLVQTYIPNIKYFSTLNGPSWYLCASFFSYMCFPAILKLFKKMSKKKVIALVILLFFIEILISIIAFISGNHAKDAWFSSQWITYYFPPVRFIDFLLGCCIGYLFFEQKDLPKKLLIRNHLFEITVCILVVLSCFVYTYEYGILGSKPVRSALLFLPTTLCLIWIVANKNYILPRILKLKPFVWFGNLSPYTFLIHAVVIKYCSAGMLKLFSYDNKYVIAALSFVATVVAAVVWQKLTKILRKK